MPVPFVKKSAAELRLQAISVLQALSIGNIYEGGKAKALIDQFMSLMEELYEATYGGIQDANPSSASGIWLDLWGGSQAVGRVLAEDDNSLRRRIQINLLNRQQCNEVAIDARLRMHPRVRDLGYQDYIYGSGSFAVIVEALLGTSVDTSLIGELVFALDGVKAKGTKTLVMGVKPIPVRLVALATGPALVKELALDAVQKYIEGLGRGESLEPDQMKAAAVNAGARSLSIQELYIKGKRALPRTQEAMWDEKFTTDPTAENPIQILA